MLCMLFSRSSSLDPSNPKFLLFVKPFEICAGVRRSARANRTFEKNIFSIIVDMFGLRVSQYRSLSAECGKNLFSANYDCCPRLKDGGQNEFIQVLENDSRRVCDLWRFLEWLRIVASRVLLFHRMPTRRRLVWFVSPKS